jgi:tetratricopeptide (TPR) repeat protein
MTLPLANIKAALAQAQQLTNDQRHLEALELLRQIHAAQPKDDATARALANTLATLRRYAEAAEVFSTVARRTKQPADLAKLAGWQDAAGDIEAALATWDKVKLPKPQMADVHVLKAGALLARARREDARAEIDAAFAANSANASLRLFIAKNFLKDFGAEAQADWIRGRLASPKADRIPAEDRARLNFALGLALEKVGDNDNAFAAIDAANRLYAPANPQADMQGEQVAAGIAQHFTKPRLAQLAPAGNPSHAPVFVTGMPRSGTTLVEQIIAAHPQAGSVGELELLPHLKQSIVSLKATDIARAGSAYLDAAQTLSPNAQRIVDKSISTLLHTGIALLLFPNARFIFVRRHPMDIFWSAYREMFGTGAMTFSYSPQTLARRIQVAEQLADEWQSRFPDRIISVNYEDLTRNQEPHSRRLVAHAGLDWDDACLNFQQAGNVVRTASMAQVREQVYTSSQGRWQAYTRQLAPVANALSKEIAAHEARLEETPAP